jgi:excisionase family DNA binding protein
MGGVRKLVSCVEIVDLSALLNYYEFYTVQLHIEPVMLHEQTGPQFSGGVLLSSQAGEEWLSLREAAELLGMHPATVRLWADRHELPSRRTSGGHRRFRRADIEARLRQEAEPKPDPSAQVLIQSLLGRVRLAFTDGTLSTLPWYQHFDETVRDAYRHLGRRLLDLLRRALSHETDKETLQREAMELGTEYGTITSRSHVSVADAVRAFLYFHTLVDEGILQLAEVRGAREQDIPWVESLYQVQAITNEILPALIEAAHSFPHEQEASAPPQHS